MKKWILIGALLAIALGPAAFASPELWLVSGSSNVVCSTSGGGCSVSGNTVSYSNTNFDSWNISVVVGVSNSPGLSGAAGSFGLDITSLTATCGSTAACSSNPLDIYLSDTGFTQVVPAGGFKTDYSSTQTGGSTSQSAWYTMSNTIFGTGHLIGTVGPFTSTNAGSASGGGPAGPTKYSLTIEDIFNAMGSGATFSTDGNVTTVPEPGAIILLGTVLVLCASKLRRRSVS